MFNTHKLVIRYIFQNDNMINLYLSPHMITFNNESKSQKMNCKFPQQAGLSVGLEEKLPIPFQLDKGGHNEAEDIPISWAYQSTNWEFLMKQFFFFLNQKLTKWGQRKGFETMEDQAFFSIQEPAGLLSERIPQVMGKIMWN